jgi:ABC-2 type transport system ATP-binding protein
MDRVIIRTEELTKRYGEHTAVEKLNLEIKEGEIFGLLGPNGAGKTTTILMLLGLTEPSSGKAWVDGNDSTKNPTKVKRIASYLPDNVGFYEDMTGRENLRLTARLNNLKEAYIDDKITALANKVGLRQAIDKKAGTYSRGMRQRLGIADILLKDPKIVVLDEPTLGIDPKGIEEILQLIRDLSSHDGLTVLVSSHLLHQIEKICDRVGIFVKGRLLACGPINTLWQQVAKADRQLLEVKVKPDHFEEVKLLLQGCEGVEEVLYQQGLYTVSCKSDIREQLVHALVKNKYTILHLRLRGGDLDDIYRRYFTKEEVI